jgi:putative acetyltransferase
VHIDRDDLSRPEVRALLEFHAEQLRATSPPESCHVLDVSELKEHDATMFSAWNGSTLLGIGGLKIHDNQLGEIKSMRTSPGHEGTGVGSAVLQTLISYSREIELSVLKLETGSDNNFASARRLYQRFGFTLCEPFADYRLDPNSCYYQLFL